MADALPLRAARAETLWREGDAAFARNDDAAAYRLYTEAHDLITDSPPLHRAAHVRLRAVNRRTGNWGEWVTDSLLLAAAPLGVFRLLALFFRR